MKFKKQSQNFNNKADDFEKRKQEVLTNWTRCQ